MRKNIVLLLVAFLILGLVLSACERPATKGPVVTPTTKGEIPFPVATQPNIVKDMLAVTQTAMALASQQPAATRTPGAGLPTIAPTSTTGPTPTQGILSTPVPSATRSVLPSPTAGRPATYVLQDGETLYCLARRFDVDPADLLEVNGLNMTTGAQLSIGTELKIPTDSSFPGSRVLHNHPDIYTVDPGDTIGTVACYYGDLSPDAILAYNGLKSGATISVGQKLEIP